MLKLIAVLWLLNCWSAYAELETLSFPVKKLDSIHLENPSGKVSIYSSDENKVVVEFEKVRFPETCDLSVGSSPSTLKVIVKEKRKSIDQESCLVHFRIRVPSDFNVLVRNGFGPLDVLGVQGELNYQIGSGDVQIDGDLRSITGRVGNGKQTFRGQSSAIALNAGRGSFRIELAQLPLKGRLSLKNGTGDALVLVPESSLFKVALQSGLGKLFNDLSESSKKSAFAITMKSGTGALRIKKN